MLLARHFTARFASALTVCLLLLSATGGCSKDIHVFRSTAISPKNIAVVSATTGETLWSMNVPEGQQLRLDFSRGESNEVWRSPDVPAKTMKWDLYTLDAIPEWGQKMKGGEQIEGDDFDLPDDQETVIRMTIREPDGGLGR